MVRKLTYIALGAILVLMACSWAVHVTTTILKAPSIAKNVQRVLPAVVHISKAGVCQGSGAIISEDGIIVTARHVTDGSRGPYCVTLNDGNRLWTSEVVEDTQNDIAFLKVTPPPDVRLPHVSLSPRSPRVGDQVYLVGSPLGYDNFNTVSQGIVSAEDRNLMDRPGWGDVRYLMWVSMIQTDCMAYPGNSGGPLFNMRDEVIGILVAGQAPGLNFSVPVVRFSYTLDTVRTWFELKRFNVPAKKEVCDYE